ncbi:MAG: lytic transglycosylase domain-containing protein [Aphanothece saxicola GSE-SYN-MK-01-06B]|jgi:hypothetical protein|nr:lytic transglycosylase domain-containing protein [Aphanothece saxicola GSE-SYN-MK-01-06B]
MRVVTPVLLALLLASAAVAVTTVTVERPPEAGAPAAPSQPLPAPLTTPTALPRAYPRLPRDPAAMAAELAALEPALRSTATPADQLPELAHRQQVIYRRLSTDPVLSALVRGFLPVRWQDVFDRHLAARREFLAMHRGGPRSAVVPAWRIREPEPAANLLRYYREAAAATGIPWEVLAAVNLVETGMGRIDGVSVADARGPMQFLPTTWAERGIGKGDIRDPEDAIHAAARYLVRRGGLKDIRKGLWGYNNSNRYVRGVLHYAELLRQDPQAFTGLYHWEIHYNSAAGDLWLPVGYNQPKPLPVTTYLKRFPGSAAPGG